MLFDCEENPKKALKTEWDISVNRSRMLEAFSIAEKHGFMKELLDDLLLASEIDQFGRRMEALHMLFAGMPYREITASTGFSSATIAWISKKTINKKGGYWLVMKSLYPHGYKYFD